MGCRDLSFDIAGRLSFPVGEEYDSVRLAVADVSRKAAKLHLVAGQQAVDAVQALADAARRVFHSGVPELPTPKGEALLRFAQKQKVSGKHGWAVVTAHSRSSDEARLFLSKARSGPSMPQHHRHHERPSDSGDHSPERDVETEVRHPRRPLAGAPCRSLRLSMRGAALPALAVPERGRPRASLAVVG